MKNQLLIKSPHLKIVQQILKKHLPLSTLILIFGSRVTGTNKKFSDLDLAIDLSGQPLSISALADLRHDFEESDLPFKVDIVDWATTDESFRKIIQQSSMVLPLR